MNEATHDAAPPGTAVPRFVPLLGSDGALSVSDMVADGRERGEVVQCSCSGGVSKETCCFLRRLRPKSLCIISISVQE